MSRQGAMMLFRAQLAAVEAEIRAKHAEIASLAAAREAAEAKLDELNHVKRKIREENNLVIDDPDDRDEQIG